MWGFRLIQIRTALAAGLLSLCVVPAAAQEALRAERDIPQDTAPADPDAAGVEASAPAEAVAAPAEPSVATERVAQWVLASGDNQGLPFAIVDKAAASVAVYGQDGDLKGAAAVLLGEAMGDDSVPGIGDKPLAAILPEERTTPAGRFLASYGPAARGRTVLWVDFGSAISMHAVITSNPKEHRLERLNSPAIDDNRITYGCINVPAAFYKDVVRQTFTGTQGVVYVLPEVRTLAEVFPAMHLAATDKDEDGVDPQAAAEEVAAFRIP
jgi:hypothetical protein